MAGNAGRSADDAARMPLMEHIRELRNRLVKAALAIIIGAVVGFIFRNHVLLALEHPVCHIRGLNGIAKATPQCPDGAIVFSGPTAQVHLSFEIAMYAGLVLGEPGLALPGVGVPRAGAVQEGEDVQPLLHRRRGAAVLRRRGGLLLPVPDHHAGAAELHGRRGRRRRSLDASQYMTFFLQMMTVFGVSFVLPLVLVLFNFIGILSSKAMRKWWRGIVLAIFVFGAVAVPTGDPFGMSALAIPICVLYSARRGHLRAQRPAPGPAPRGGRREPLAGRGERPGPDPGADRRAESLEDIL